LTRPNRPLTITTFGEVTQEGAAHAMALAVMSGAGISSDPPASLPLGAEFHEYLVSAYLTATDQVAPGVLTAADRAALAHGRWDLIARLENCGVVAATGVAACFAVTVPSEAQLLAALHLAGGGMHVTLNFDDGVEVAYALLRGDRELPTDAGPAYHAALNAWRRMFPPNAAPLRVVAAMADLQPTKLGRRPLLVKLRGCAQAGTGGLLRPAAPVIDEAEAMQLDTARLRVLDTLAESGFLLITGCSGSDADCFEALVPRLRRGSFAWAAWEISPAVARRLRAIDPCQPIRMHPPVALGAYLPGVPPPWPRHAPVGCRFAERFAAWQRSIDPAAVAEACAWTLADAQRHDEAAEVLRRLLALGGNPRTELRLADVSAARGRPGDQQDADRRYLAVARRVRVPTPLRAYALTRWSGTGVPLPGWFGRVLARIAALALAWLLLSKQGRWSAGRAKVVQRLADMLLGCLRPGLALPFMWPHRLWRRVLVGGAAATIGWMLRGGDGIGVGRGRVALHRQLAELEGMQAALHGQPAPAAALHCLAWAERVCAHFGDLGGLHAARSAQELLVSLNQAKRLGQSVPWRPRPRPARRGARPATPRSR
jgi:hypothetical protein